LGALARSIEAIANRHEVLRTAFPIAGDEAAQRVAPPRPAGSYELPVIDLRSQAGDREAAARAIATAEYHRSFDLQRGPVWRALLVIVDDGRHWLVLCAHHIALDGWSVNLYLSELRTLYRAFVEGSDPALPALDTQYVDFSMWQRANLAGEALDAQLAYWTAHLEGAPAVLELPADRPRPPVQTFRGGLVPVALSPHQSRRVRALALQHRATPFMVLLAVLQVLVHRFTGQRDLLIGSPVANRPRREVEGLLGCFVNNLVLRARFDARQSFADRLAATRDDTLAALAHQDVPFELLVDRLKAPRDLSRNPLFQVMFALQNTPRSAVDIPGLSFESILPDSEITKFDLSLNLLDAPAFTGYFEYSSELFDRETIAALRDAFLVLLDSALDAPEQRVDDLAILSAAQERELVTPPPRDRAAPAPRTIAELFLAQVAARPDERCLVTESESLSYREVAERALGLARALTARGVGPEVRVGICMKRTADLPIAMMAVFLAGGACVPMDPRYPRDRLWFMAADSGLSLILAEASARSVLDGAPHRVVWLDEARTDGADGAGGTDGAEVPHAGAGAAPPARADHLAYVIYTSGSTGRPKGVALSHRGVSALMDWSLGVYSDDDLRGVLASTSICFDLSIFELFITWGRGGTVVLVDSLLDVPRTPLSASIRLINTVPSAMTELVRMSAVPPGARVVNLAGEPIRQALVDDLYALGTVRDVFNLYGPTEDTVYSTFARLAAGAPGSPPIGVAIDPGRAYVLDHRMRPVPVGVKGELYLGGEGLARGYLNQPALTATRFVPSPFGPPGARLYRTGDIARWRRDGQLEFLGRNDGQVKLRGFRIELGEIEEALSRHPAVREAAVLVQGDGTAGDRLVAYAAIGHDACTAADLRRHLHTTLPAYMVPAIYVLPAALPHTPNGKIDRRALPPPPVDRDAAPALALPATAMEHQIAAIWRDVLGLTVVGSDDNFFDLGGHSLLLTRVHARLDGEYPGRVTLTELFQYPTVRALAAFIAGGADRAADGERGRDRASVRQHQRAARHRMATPEKR
ncbi:MAG TPA: amino acid adenylation domain-containing protein, partial [Kofleriaceae bacterium]|nr:amino acid adenylation domain-containing protein [Kofleriaceae bacterium]